MYKRTSVHTLEVIGNQNGWITNIIQNVFYVSAEGTV